METEYTNFKIETNDIIENSVNLIIDCKNSKVNVIDNLFINELTDILTKIKENSTLKTLVIKSGKKTGFIAGADIKQFTQVGSAQEATELISKGQELLEILENLTCTTIVLVEGCCLGGGYELALACDYIIAVDLQNTKLGLPEVMLGIHPGWGGSVRLPRRIGSIKALELIITGKIVTAKNAYKLKLVDNVVKFEHINNALKYFAQNKPEKITAPWCEKIFSINLIKSLVGKIFKYKLSKKINIKHYPSPYAVIDNWVKYDIWVKTAYIKEAESIGKLLMTDSAQNLIRVFFLRNKLKDYGKGKNFIGTKVHVIGAGIMGGMIAAWCAKNGYTVTLQDTNLIAIAKSLQTAKQMFCKLLKEPHLVQAACDRLTPDPTGLGVINCDLVIEAIIENLEEKQRLFAELEKKVKATTILSTNTSTIPLEKIAKQMDNPNRLIGIHFFNPVDKMALVEVIYGKETDQEVINNSMSFVTKLGKLPLKVKSSPGFLVNRVLIPYLIEAIKLYEEGVHYEAIDQATLEFGMPMGPMELADTVGLDICKACADSLGIPLPEIIIKFIEKNKLGKKTGKGFYKYRKGKISKSNTVHKERELKEIRERLIGRLLKESEACLLDEIIESEDYLDAGMIFGTGFAPFRGGPMQYIKRCKEYDLNVVSI